MSFSDTYLQVLGAILVVSMALVAAANWLNRKHGGFAKGWGGAIFITICWFGAIAIIVLKLSA